MTDARPFEILPAIDLRGSRVVRLEAGDFDRATAFSSNPAAVARQFMVEGARWIHVVDLDGAREGAPAHVAAIARIVETVGDRVNVEVAGGLRDAETVRRAFEAGAARVVIGTAALEDPSFAGRLIATHGSDRLAVAIDVRSGRAVGHGWVGDAAGVDVAEAINRLADLGVTTFEVTAIDRDGLLLGPDMNLYPRIIELERGEVIASAGVATLDHLRQLSALGCAGAIVGRALYDGSLQLTEALRLRRGRGVVVTDS